MILGAVYMLLVYNRIFFGNIKNISIIKFSDVSKKELYIFGLLIFFLLIMGIYPKVFLDTFHNNVLNLIVQFKHFSI